MLVAPDAPADAPAVLALGGTDAPQQGADAYLDMDNEIRGQWLERPRDIGGASGLEEALLVELPCMCAKLKVRAPVTRWGGHKGQEPQAADFLIRYSPRPGELDRELAAIALVVGRYLSIYRLDSERLTVELEGPDGVLRRVKMPPKEALRLYEQQVSLVDFLTQLAGG